MPGDLRAIGDKPLKTGVSLSERALSSDVIARAVKGRLRDGTEEERQAVTLYISSLMKTSCPEVRVVGQIVAAQSTAESDHAYCVL